MILQNHSDKTVSCLTKAANCNEKSLFIQLYGCDELLLEGISEELRIPL